MNTKQGYTCNHTYIRLKLLFNPTNKICHITLALSALSSCTGEPDLLEIKETTVANQWETHFRVWIISVDKPEAMAAFECENPLNT